MLIFAENKVINLEQVFFFSVDKFLTFPNADICCKEKKYALRAHHSSLSDNEENSDCVLIKIYNTQSEAAADLNKITAAYEMDISCINLDKN